MSSKLEDKLFHYEAEPPTAVWEKIATVLNEETPALSDRLYHYMQQPPANIWENIDQQLQTEDKTSTKVVQIKKYKKTLRYAAAAVIIVCLAGAAYLLSNNSTATAGLQKTDHAHILKTIKAAVPQKTAIEDVPATPPATSIVVITHKPEPKPASSIAKTTTRKLVSAKKSYVSLPPKEIAPKNVATVLEPSHIINTAHAERYMVATTASGNAVRLPKKIYSAFTCSDESHTFSTKDCQAQLASLQSKMSTTLATDFVGFLDLIKNLQENKK